jgi:predicted RNA-binding protein with PUA-like domain
MPQPAPGLWLFKEEPECYAFDQFEKDRTTLWTGVSNALALKNLRLVKPGDRVWFYHTGKVKAVVGEMRAVAAAEPDPDAGDPKLVAVRVEFVRRLANPVTLADIKADPQLAEWELVQLPRLSIVPVTNVQWKRVEEMAKKSR